MTPTQSQIERLTLIIKGIEAQRTEQGLVIVPREATKEMIEEGNRQLTASKTWEAMVACALGEKQKAPLRGENP